MTNVFANFCQFCQFRSRLYCVFHKTTRVEVEEDKAIWHWDHMLVQLEAPDQVRHFKDGKTTKESNDNGDEPA